MSKLKGHVFLVGFMGVGKSTVSHELSRKLEISEIDTDSAIIENEKMSIPEIFEKKGEAYFRKCETRLLFSIMQISPRVVSCGGGIVLNEMNVNQMREVGTIVLLTATPETIYERVKGNKDRPLLKGRLTVKGIEKLMNERKEAYENAADVVIPTDGLTPNDVAQRIEAAISPRA